MAVRVAHILCLLVSFSSNLKLYWLLYLWEGEQCAFEFSPASDAKRLNEDSPPGCPSQLNSS